MKIITDGKLVIKSWCNNPEDGAIAQALNMANLPFAFKHIALMPDTHQGYGMPVGGVLATKGVIIPNAVGVDIGCGMLVVKTSLTEINQDIVKSLLGAIRKAVPVGFNHHKEKQPIECMPKSTLDGDPMTIVSQEFDKARYQVGTLGGGNHFIEIQKGSDGYIWFMIHSGSRNIGYRTANHHNKMAKEINAQYFTSVPEEYDLAFLPVDSLEANLYIAEMRYCTEFALTNRQRMAELIKEVFTDQLDVGFVDEINIPHNYAALENHFGQNVWVHRKGATSAREGERGIIPGSQGTKSYIVQGKGNPESFMSCSHGAGRVMGRMAARRNLDLAAEKKMLEDQGIVHSIRNEKDLDEAPSSYKPIDVVMEEQKDLVDILVELTPLGVIKG